MGRTDRLAPRAPVLGVSINAIELVDAVERVVAAAREPTPFGVSALAVHGVMSCVADRELQFRVNSLEMVVPDGQPLRWALGWRHGLRLSERVYGPDLMAAVCKRASEERLPVFLFGSSEDTLSRLTAGLEERYPALIVAGTQPSRFRDATEAEARRDVETIHASGARIVFVGLGCPRQEIWTYENRVALGVPVLAVGAAFDYHAGRLRRPPEWMQRSGLEWLYRLLQEPSRLWRRYLLLNPAYLSLLGLDMLGMYRLTPARGRAPTLSRRPG